MLGEGVVYTCVAKASNIYEVTLADGDSVKIAACGVTVGQDTYECREVVQDTLVVSFMNMSGYIGDIDIKTKLNELGVEIVGDIKRRLHPGTKVEDGTRYMRVKFPPTIKSLPYSMKFFNGKNWEHVRVIHNDQTKTCRQCMSTEHLFRDCPEFLCFKCGNQGHMARMCREKKCRDCGKYGKKCECDNETLEDCEFCGKCACQCDYCDWCGRLRQYCICSPDDICRFCSVELENCQCIACGTCGKLNCWCEHGPGVSTDHTRADAANRDQHVTVETRDMTAVTSGHGVAEQHVTDQPEDSQTTPEPGEAPKPVTETGSDRDCNHEPESREPDVETGFQPAEHRDAVKGKPDTIKDISKVVLHPGGSQSSSMRSPSSAPIRKPDGTLVHRRRRLVTEPNISPVKSKKKNIETNCDID